MIQPQDKILYSIRIPALLPRIEGMCAVRHLTIGADYDDTREVVYRQDRTIWAVSIGFLARPELRDGVRGCTMGGRVSISVDM